jgi:hypothetical protein
VINAKKITPSTKGLTILPINSPSFIQTLLNGVSRIGDTIETKPIIMPIISHPYTTNKSSLLCQAKAESKTNIPLNKTPKLRLAGRCLSIIFGIYHLKMGKDFIDTICIIPSKLFIDGIGK